MEFEVHSVVCRLWSAKCSVWNVEREVWSVKRRMQGAECEVLSAVWGV